ncbi:MAG: tripartite tricarboxylate transporter substrate binding protein [Betaproteobacteria bacterium]|nr:MAG: tripartite tricarboxylate transporter substrate binding protein [Betaproteobacteria bacterium]
MQMHRALSLGLAVILTPAALPASGQSSAFPNRGVTLIVPFAPGATTDVLGRLIAQKLSEAWGQPVVVENRTGASGTIGLAAVAKAPADGYTLGMMIVSNATHAAMYGAKSPIDLIKDFAPVTHAASQPYLLFVNASLPVRSVRDLVALARARPGELTYGSSGVGSVLHLAGELLAAQAKVKLTHVPYKGAAPALSDVAGGHIAMLFTTRVTAQSLLASGKVRALAVTSSERVAGIPDVPTVRESGVTGPFEVNGWYGLSTAAGAPAPVVERLSAEINRVLKLPDVRDRMQASGTLTVGSTPAQFGELLRNEIQKWRRIIEQAGISPGTR